MYCVSMADRDEHEVARVTIHPVILPMLSEALDDFSSLVLSVQTLASSRANTMHMCFFCRRSGRGLSEGPLGVG